VVLENTSYSEVLNSPSAPYLNSLLAQGALVTNYYANTHPSIDNYFTMIAGKGEANNNDNFSGVIGDDNAARELTAVGKTWKVYAESIPAAGYLGSNYPATATIGTGNYLQHHNPFSYLSDVADNPQQSSNIVSMTQFASDLNSGTLPNYAFLVPNSLNDGHDCPVATCTTAAPRVADADAWVKNNIDPLLKSAAFQQNGLLIIIYDEAELSDTSNGFGPTGGGGHVFALLLGAGVKAGYQAPAGGSVYDHRSLLRLTMDALGATSPSPAASAAQMAEFFTQYP
jgi:acid phosphatase